MAADKMNWKRPIIIILLGIIVFFIIIKYIGIGKFIDTSIKININLLLLAIIIHYMGFGIRALRWKMILDSLGYKQKVKKILGYTLSGWFVSAVFPARLGDPFKAYMLKKDMNVPFNKCIGSVIVERMMDIFVILLFSLISSYLVLRNKMMPWLANAYIIGFALLLLFPVAIIFLPRIKSLKIFNKKERVKRIICFMAETMISVRQFTKKKVHVLFVFLMTVVIWFMDVVVAYAIIAGLGYSINITYVSFAIFGSILFSLIPITPGAVGQIEFSTIYLFSIVGVPKTISGTMILIYQLVVYWSFLLVTGIVFYLMGIPKLIDSVSKRYKEWKDSDLKS